MPQLGERTLVEGHYYNANYYACAIVAVTTHGIDWAAYIGGCNYELPWKEAYEFVAEHGCKLSREDAKYFFPDIKLPYRA